MKSPLSSRSMVVAKSRLIVLAIFASFVVPPQISRASAPNLGKQSPQANPTDNLCPAPVLSRITRHRVVSGETLDSIAKKYGLIPATIIGFNPATRNGQVAVGSELQIPPVNGIRVEAPAGSSWRDLGSAYNVRADVVFEANGCQRTVPRVVFIPGANWSPGSRASTASPVSRYPLPANAPILTGYGWQINPETNTVEFHSGVDLEAKQGTAVVAAGAGTVAFTGQQTGYGNLVVINHDQGLQTRYAQLDSITVEAGQRVSAGDRIGTVGVTGPVPSPRLHFEVRTNSDLGWVAQDPGNYLESLRVEREQNQPRR